MKRFLFIKNVVKIKKNVKKRKKRDKNKKRKKTFFYIYADYVALTRGTYTQHALYLSLSLANISVAAPISTYLFWRLCVDKSQKLVMTLAVDWTQADLHACIFQAHAIISLQFVVGLAQ